MKNKSIWVVVACLVTLSLVLAACAPQAPTTATTPTTPTTQATSTTPATPTTPTTPAAEKPKYGGAITAIILNMRGFSPVVAADTTSTLYTLHFTNDGLWSGDWGKGPAGTNQADFLTYTWGMEFGTVMLAESYELPSADTVIYHIRKGVHFGLDPTSEASRLANGRELTADDVAFSLNAIYFDPDGPGGGWGRIKPEEKPISIEATDKYTVTIKMKPGTLSSTLYYTSTFTYMFPPEVYQKYNKMRDWTTAVGTGPFFLKDFVVGTSATLDKNPNYWKTDPVGPGKGNKLPYIDRFKMLIITDRSTQLAAFRTGKVDVLGTPVILRLEDKTQLVQQRPDINLVKYPSATPDGVAFRMDKPELPWYDIKVRQALTKAINYDEVYKDYFDGDAQWVFPISPFKNYIGMYVPPEQWPPAVKDLYTYDLPKAKQLLADAGYPNGFNISVVTLAQYVDDLSLIASYWEKLGVKMAIDVRENAVWTSITNVGAQKEAVGYYWSTGTVFDFDRINPNTPNNFARVNDPYCNKVYQDTREDYILQESKLYPMMKEYANYLLQQAWYITLPGPNGYNFWQPWLKNYHGEVDIGACTRLIWGAYVWVDQDLKKSMGY